LHFYLNSRILYSSEVKMLKKINKKHNPVKISYTIAGESYELHVLSEGVAADYVKKLLKMGIVTDLVVQHGNKIKILRRSA